MLVTLLEITILPKEEQLANANAPMLLTLSGRTRLLKEEQLANAPFPMRITLSGITIPFKKERSIGIRHPNARECKLNCVKLQ